MANARVVFASGESRVEIEGNPAFVEKHLKQLLPLITHDGSDQKRTSGSKQEPVSAVPSRSLGTQRQSLKAFFEMKAPQNAYEAISVALYHRLKAEGKNELSGTEIRDTLVQGGYRPPDIMPQALTDCRRRYGYIQPGSKKGMWKLTHGGETTVEFDLPHKS